MIRRPPRSTLFPYTSSSDLRPRVLHYVLRRRVGTNESPRKAHHCRMEASDQAEERALVSGAERLDQRRSEEHTSELQSRPHLVCRLLLEKKKQGETVPQQSH